jgi:hypothetical protein
MAAKVTTPECPFTMDFVISKIGRISITKCICPVISNSTQKGYAFKKKEREGKRG